MLSPDYIYSCGREVEELYETLNQEITSDICRRIVKTGRVTTTAAWQAKQLQQSGYLMEDIIRDVAYSTGMSEREIKKLFRDAGVASLRFDVIPFLEAGMDVSLKLSPAMKQVLLANMLKTCGDMSRLTMTTASAGQMTFIEAMNEAVMKVESGAFSYEAAIRTAINQCARTGAVVLYDSGAHFSLEAAARMNILTGVNQTANKITEMTCQELGAEYVETSAHAGARPSHAVWQGRVFKLDGSDRGHENFQEATGYGTAGGLGGVNCRHSFHPFILGVSKPLYSKEILENYERPRYTYNGKELTEYEASQIQRGLERSIRESKRTLAGFKAGIESSKEEALIKSLQEGQAEARLTYNRRRAKLTEFCNQTGREKEYIRHKIPELPKSA